MTLFVADPLGGVYTTTGNERDGWAPWTSVSEGSTKPGARVTAIVTAPNRIALFLADPEGGVYTTLGNPAQGWRPWTSVSEGSTTPGGYISAIATSASRIVLFLADPECGVYTTSGNAVRAGGRGRASRRAARHRERRSPLCLLAAIVSPSSSPILAGAFTRRRETPYRAGGRGRASRRAARDRERRSPQRLPAQITQAGSLGSWRRHIHNVG